jgi:hypothetical protein
MGTESEQQQETVASGRHAAPDGAPRDPRIDISRDPTPGVPDHAAPDDED